jgi:hypothetical protein
VFLVPPRSFLLKLPTNNICSPSHMNNFCSLNFFRRNDIFSSFRPNTFFFNSMRNALIDILPFRELGFSSPSLIFLSKSSNQGHWVQLKVFETNNHHHESIVVHIESQISSQGAYQILHRLRSTARLQIPSQGIRSRAELVLRPCLPLLLLHRETDCER